MIRIGQSGRLQDDLFRTIYYWSDPDNATSTGHFVPDEASKGVPMLLN